MNDEEDIKKRISDEGDRVSLFKRRLSVLEPSLKSKQTILDSYAESKNTLDDFSDDELNDLLLKSQSALKKVDEALDNLFWRILSALKVYDRSDSIISSYVKDNRESLLMLFTHDYLQSLKRIDLVTIPEKLSEISSSRSEYHKELSLIKNEYEKAYEHYCGLYDQYLHLMDLARGTQAKLLDISSKIDNECIVGEKPFDVSEDNKETFKAELMEKIPETKEFTDDQWQFILSTNRNTYVVAGAGSGKSTTLIYRVIFLHKYAPGFKIDKTCTIFTFTKKTRVELIEKLQKALSKLKIDKIDCSEEFLANVVHTFHSKAWQVASAAANQTDLEFFEFQGKETFYFSKVEFGKQAKSIEKLCSAITNDGYVTIPLSAAKFTVNWLNEFLRRIDLCKTITTVFPSIAFAGETKKLKGRTSVNRNRPFDELRVKEQQEIIKLNRLLIEQLYPDETPKLPDIKEAPTDDAISPQMTEEQAYLLNKAYAYAWNYSKKFHDAVCDLYEKTRMLAPVINPGEWKDSEYSAHYYAQKEDEELIDDCLLLARRYVNSEDITEREQRKSCKFTYRIEKYPPYTLYAHHCVKTEINGESIMYLVHYLPYEEADGDLRGQITRKKRIIVTHDAINNHIFIENEDDYKRWKKYGQPFRRGTDGIKEEPLYFKCELPGYIKPEEIVDALYTEGSFMEYLGLDVVKDCSRILMSNKLDKTSVVFFRVLRMFWPMFEQYLNRRGIKRFHEVFTNYFFENAKKHVRRMQDVMIDEFQDINPEIARWIKKILLYLKNEYSCAVTCVGDDYQSIYGWRGSAPVYFLNYEDNFPSRNIIDPPVKMVHNFRSLQSIIDAGQTVLEGINKSIPKKCKQGRKDIMPLDDKQVEIVEIADDNDIDNVIAEQLHKYQRKCKKVFIMSRTNNPLKNYRPHKNIIYQTYHKSKGLEADLCILLNDCAFYDPYPIRNAIYELAWEGQHDYNLTYDQAQEDETKRLAYVAITRSMRKVIIFNYKNDDTVGAFAPLKKGLSAPIC